MTYAAQGARKMSLHQFERPPPYSHDLDDLRLPSLPAGDLHHSPQQLPILEPLPSLRLLSNGLDSARSPRSEHDTLYKTISGQRRAEMKPISLPRLEVLDSPDLSASTDNTGRSSMDDYKRKDVSVLMQDADDRMAAEALCGLGQRESTRPEAAFTDSSAQYRLSRIEYRRQSGNANEGDEPLLDLLASTHPWLGGTINGSLSAYSSTKSYSPRFIQYGADYIERNIGSPVVTTVGTVGRRTGVEGSLRRYLGSRRVSEVDRIDPLILDQDVATAYKRRRLQFGDDEEMDTEHDLPLEPVHRTVSGHASIDTLPPYDENRSPAYEEGTSASVTETPRARHKQFRPAANRSWSTQLMISTSGLGAALNEASLRSLKYCLTILRSANMHVRHLMDTLKRLLSDYSNSRSPHSPENLEAGSATPKPSSSSSNTTNVRYTSASNTPNPTHAEAGHREHPATIASRIHQLNDEIWQTFKTVVSSISTYTGGALPENEGSFVRWQLMSVPRRWQRAVVSASPSQDNVGDGLSAGHVSSVSASSSQQEQEAVSSAHRMLAFALEGLDMMDQVGNVVDSTIVCAEEWLESLGRRRGDAGEEQGHGEDKSGALTPTPMDTSA